MIKGSMTQNIRSNTQGFIQTKEVFDKNYLKDFWIGTGYSCGERHGIPEDVNIEYLENGEFTATKVHGDACVPKGAITFRGKIPDSFDTNVAIPCTVTLGDEEEPASQTAPCKLRPVDKNNFIIEDYKITFKRGRLPEEPEEPKKEEPKKEEPKPKEITITKKIIKPIIYKYVQEECKPEKDTDDTDVYRKRYDFVEKFKRSKNSPRVFKIVDFNENGPVYEVLDYVPSRLLRGNKKIFQLYGLKNRDNKGRDGDDDNNGKDGKDNRNGKQCKKDKHRHHGKDRRY